MIVGEFLQWMETAPAGQRADAAAALARTYLYSEVDDETRSDIEAALTVALDDESADVRFALADALGASEMAPRHIVIALAADQVEIATIVLSRSPIFIDAELVDIVAAASGPLQLAVASRPAISGAVAASIAEVGERDACAALIVNSGAAIARVSYRRIAERFGDDGEIREALLGRELLPAEVRQLLIHSVTEALGGMAIAKAWMPENRVRAITRDACDRATVAIAAETETEDLPALVEHLRVTGQLTTSLLLRAVCAGNIPLFETALSALARVPQHRVAALMRANRLSGMRAIYARAGLPVVAFDGFTAALDTWRRLSAEDMPADRYRFTMEMVEAVLSRYADISEGDANELAAMLRRFAADQAREAARDYAREIVAA